MIITCSYKKDMNIIMRLYIEIGCAQKLFFINYFPAEGGEGYFG